MPIFLVDLGTELLYQAGKQIEISFSKQGIVKRLGYLHPDSVSSPSLQLGQVACPTSVDDGVL
jgi:hypothetical protein